MAAARERPPFYRSLAPLLIWQEVPRPVDWAKVFGRKAPVELEIGIGSGEYLTRLAQTHPDRNFAGIELRWASVKRTLRNLARRTPPAFAPVTNVRLVMEDARPVVERMLAARSLTRVHLLFPCPWRKERHEHHRLLQPSFLRLLNSRLADGGEILCVTDWKPLFEWTLAQVPGTGLVPDCEVVAPRYGTKYERKWEGKGQQQFFEIHLRKQEHHDAPVPEDATLNPHQLHGVDLDRCAPQDELGAITIAFKEIVKDRERGVLLARTVIVEEPLTQQIWICLSRARDGSWWITPARGCSMVPTAGVQRALDRLAEAARATVAPQA